MIIESIDMIDRTMRAHIVLLTTYYSLSEKPGLSEVHKKIIKNEISECEKMITHCEEKIKADKDGKNS